MGAREGIHPWRRSFKRGNRPALFELELERLAEEGEGPSGIQSGRGAGLTDESDGAAHAKLSVEGRALRWRAKRVRVLNRWTMRIR